MEFFRSIERIHNQNNSDNIFTMVIFEPNNIKIERQVIAMRNLPPAFDGAKIVQLSDLHSLRFGSQEKKVLRILEKINPDFIFITGDFVDPATKMITDRNLSSVRVFWQELGKKYNSRIYAVLGNHDNKLVRDYLEMSGIEILDNKNKKLWIGNDFIYLVGVNDPWTGKDDLSKAMAETEKNRSKILLAHGPEIVPEIIGKTAAKEIDLVLVGHTHGGQVNIPVIGRFIQPLSKYGRKYISGLFKIENTYLYVNRGIGTSVFPVRFNCPPEITLIELR